MAKNPIVLNKNVPQENHLLGFHFQNYFHVNRKQLKRAVNTEGKEDKIVSICYRSCGGQEGK